MCKRHFLFGNILLQNTLIKGNSGSNVWQVWKVWNVYKGVYYPCVHFGTYGAETRKKQKRRERLYDETFKHNPNLIPKYSKIKRGSRGGWIKNPLKEVTKNSGSNVMYEQKIKEEVFSKEDECIKRLIQLRKHLESRKGERCDEEKGQNESWMSIKKEDNDNNAVHNKNGESKNIDFFSICENFMETKNEISHRVEAPQYFVDKHIKSLVNEYGNINALHENCSEYKYARTPEYLKSVKRNGWTGEKNKTYRDDKDWGGRKKGEEERIIQESEEETIEKEDLHQKDTENKNGFAKELIENFLNYADDSEFDISCFDTFSLLSTVDRNRTLGSYFKSRNASFILYNNCIIPSKFTEGALSEYNYTRTVCSLFDKSYQLVLRFTGKDSLYICNQFLSSDLYDLKNSDICYSCILDNKSFVIDTCYVVKEERGIVLIASGHYKKGIYEFLSDYIVFCKDSGMDVDIQVEISKRVLSLQGPFANIAFNDVVEFFEWGIMEHEKKTYLNRVIDSKKNEEQRERDAKANVDMNRDINRDMNEETHMNEGTQEGKPNDSCLFFKQDENATFINPPYMTCHKMTLMKKSNNSSSVSEHELWCLRIGDSGEDGYEFIIDNQISDIFVDLLLQHKKIKVAGAYALDMLRMESGFPLFGIDIIKNVSPIAASLSWTLKYKKIKERNIFGYSNLLKEYAKSPKFLRIGVICNELIFKTCKILSLPYKEPIGFITSSTWSPFYKKRIAQGYIKREFAKNNEKVIISIPNDIPEEFSKKKKYKILRSRSLHKYAVAQICALPFVEHRY